MEQETNAPGSLPNEQYHLFVSPALQVAAEIAAARGDRDLYNDMASMLALMTVVQELAQRYLHAHAQDPGLPREAIEAAPASVCIMALRRGELETEAITDCIDALHAATHTLVEAGILGHEARQITPIWEHLQQGRRDEAIARLKFVMMNIITAIDEWERARGDGMLEA